jgi:hypothetical protein
MREYTPHIKINFTSDIRRAKYPEDCKMNALCFGKRIFARLDSLSEAIKNCALQKGFELINTAQGYPACTVLALGDSHAICADRGMAKVLSEHGIKVTLIREGYISLPPHSYGFIGGASGVHGGTVYFFGDIFSHPDAQEIQNAIHEAGFTAVSLSDEPLRDFGGMIFL